MDMDGLSITLIGAGHMGQALAGGWLKGQPDRSLTIVEPNPSDTIQAWADAGRIHLNPAPTSADILVVAVKPQIFTNIVAELSGWSGPQTLTISVMAGIQLHSLQEKLGTMRVVRAIPNTPGLIGKGVTLISVPKDGDPEDLAIATELLEPLGIVEGPVPEDRLAAGMAISSCSPAFVYLLAEVMAASGEAEGLDPELASRIARHAIEGAAAMMASSRETPQELRRAVTSPGGTTQAALDVLMDEGGFPSIMRKAVKAVIARDRELARNT